MINNQKLKENRIFQIRKNTGAYSVEFVSSFILVLFFLFLIVEIGRFSLSRSVAELRFRELVYDSRVNPTQSVSSLVAKYFNNQRFIDKKDITIKAKYCETVEFYVSQSCASGTGGPQNLVEFSMEYRFRPILPGLEIATNHGWEHYSIFVVWNEPSMESSKW